MSERALTTSQACERLQCSLETLYGLLNAKRIPAVKLGRTWRISERGLNDFISGEQPPTPETPAQVARRKAAESKLPVVPFFHHDRTTLRESLIGSGRAQ